MDPGSLGFTLATSNSVASGIGGMMMGIAASNLYYPAASVSGSVMAGRISTSMMGGAIGNLMSEFWPDLQQKFFKKHFK